ncbi:hypothetical protein O9992_27310 [Vibrio lentus]|nr:hypothetical protein [Vibrio lentus]
MSVAEQANGYLRGSRKRLFGRRRVANKSCCFLEEGTIATQRQAKNPELFDTINANGDYNDEIDGALAKLGTSC